MHITTSCGKRRKDNIIFNNDCYIITNKQQIERGEVEGRITI